jgi:hypothetical protein
MNLYQINKDLEKLLLSSIDGDGVIQEGFEDDIDEMFAKKEEKLLNCAKYIKNETALVNMIKEEEKALSERRKKIENRIEWFKKYVAQNMEAGEKYQDSQAQISIRKNKAVEILDETKIPKELCNHVPECWNVDKKAIKASIKAGNEIEGAKLVTNLNLQVK